MRNAHPVGIGLDLLSKLHFGCLELHVLGVDVKSRSHPSSRLRHIAILRFEISDFAELCGLEKRVEAAPTGPLCSGHPRLRSGIFRQFSEDILSPAYTLYFEG